MAAEPAFRKQDHWPRAILQSPGAHRRPGSVSEDDPGPVPRKWWKYLLLLLLFGLLALGATAWYMTTESFQAFVRARIVAAMEKATGGRVELGTYHTIPFRLQAEIRGLTIHGTEAASDVPLAHVDRVVAATQGHLVAGDRVRDQLH